jgi:hypothetical protein|tara:strand:+ start:198 stop:461 length:264 start_codon:yes stop_codon:yes gene_type:complete
MLVKLSYWEVEEAVINYLKKVHSLKLDSEQVEWATIETTETTYAYKQNKEGEVVVDRAKTTEKTESLAFNSESEMDFYIEARGKNND